MSKVASCMSSQFSQETRFPERILYGGWAGFSGSVVCFSHKKQVESRVSTCLSLFLPLTSGGFLSKSWTHRAAGKPCSCSPHLLYVAAIRHWSFVHSPSLAFCKRPTLGTQCGFCYLSLINQACAARPIRGGGKTQSFSNCSWHLWIYSARTSHFNREVVNNYQVISTDTLKKEISKHVLRELETKRQLALALS